MIFRSEIAVLKTACVCFFSLLPKAKFIRLMRQEYALGLCALCD